MCFLFFFYLNDAAVECSSAGCSSGENKLSLPLGNGKGHRGEFFLKKNNTIWQKCRWKPTCNFQNNNNVFFFMDLEIHLHFRF